MTNTPRQLALVAAAAALLGGCGLVALPFRATGAVVKVVPVVGGVAAAPFDATGDVID
ncbi:MAG: DUF6726 family protein [Janthinobacterium lividum]